MRATLEVISVSSVPSTYRWDFGVPSVDYLNLTNLSPSPEFECLGRHCLDWKWSSRQCAASAQTTWSSVSTGQVYEKKWNDPNEQGCTEFQSPLEDTYVGYAPLVFVTLSSELLDLNSNQVAATRIIDFGDYYNSETSSIKFEGTDKTFFCHSYIMPGTYKIKLSHTEYITINDPSDIECLGRHCLDWKWSSRQCDASETTTWSNVSSGQIYEKKWDDPTEQGCVDFFSTVGFYTERSNVDKLYGIAWQWYNFLSGSDLSFLNREITWNETVFQGPDQLTWNSATAPCIDLNFGRGQINWNWELLELNNVDPRNKTITWGETICESPLNKKWSESQNPCIETTPELFVNTKTITKEITIVVLEQPPTAYLSAQQPLDINQRVSPLTVRLTPRFTQCGSFPIDKIVWNLGDGSPLLVQRRWSPTYESPFVYSNALSSDYKDPRNYDVVHTYTKTAETGFSFYPSITAYSSSTGTYNCCSTVVGPLKLENLAASQKRVRVIQNEINENNKLLVGQIGNDVCVWQSK